MAESRVSSEPRGRGGFGGGFQHLSEFRSGEAPGCGEAGPGPGSRVEPVAPARWPPPVRPPASQSLFTGQHLR